jgi:hypothetical protein
MRHAPEDDHDREELAKLNAAPWQVELLSLNPGYSHWGPHEDYMWNDKGGWDSRIIRPSWPKLEIQLDELNEVVNFHFDVLRATKRCETCQGRFYHPDAQWVSESFYKHSSPFREADWESERVLRMLRGSPEPPPIHLHNSYPDEETLARYKPEFRRFCEQMRDGDGEWIDKITQDEVDALVAAGRLRQNVGRAHDGLPWIPDMVNAAQRTRDFMGHHDAINKSILIRQRCERFGIPVLCPTCDGSGTVFVEPEAHVALVMWLIHPRKGASRGVEIERIEREDLPAVFAYLKEAARRNAERFAKVVEVAV